MTPSTTFSSLRSASNACAVTGETLGLRDRVSGRFWWTACWAFSSWLTARVTFGSWRRASRACSIAALDARRLVRLSYTSAPARLKMRTGTPVSARTRSRFPGNFS
ncbi:hypothetical protein [Lysobacter gummosus]|uniref:hypothetical protein n=1 Tax=Lysobacter gummosus TaxID=262324 RepID=UPI00362EF765